MVPMRTQAIQKMRKAIKMLAQAGCINEAVRITMEESDVIKGDFFEDDVGDEVCFDCAVCGDYHHATFRIKKPKDCIQYVLEINLTYDWGGFSFLDRLCHGLRAFWKILRGKSEEHDALLGDNDMNEVRDFFRRMDREEARIGRG